MSTLVRITCFSLFGLLSACGGEAATSTGSADGGCDLATCTGTAGPQGAIGLTGGLGLQIL